MHIQTYTYIHDIHISIHNKNKNKSKSKTEGKDHLQPHFLKKKVKLLAGSSGTCYNPGTWKAKEGEFKTSLKFRRLCFKIIKRIWRDSSAAIQFRKIQFPAPTW